MRNVVLITGLLLLLAIEILHVYFIMPFPGSQKADTISLAYWLEKNINWLRLLLLAIIAYPVVVMMKQQKRWPKILLVTGLVFYAVVFYMFNYRFLADKMFYQPGTKTFTSFAGNTVKEDKLVIGVTINGEAKAYPIQMIGYHHQVRDSIGGQPVMVTYCTVCRTGRVFSPVVNGHDESFRLVGMDHFNAMFEDKSTKSWWRQATGEAIAGPMKGKKLTELPSQQMALAAWLKTYPASTIMQPDTMFNKEYEELAGFDKGIVKGGLEKRDSGSWNKKSWVIGVSVGEQSKAYDWNELVAKQIIQDELGGLPLLITIESDTATFHALNRNVNGMTLEFEKKGITPGLKDLNTGSSWDADGRCIDGDLKGKSLAKVQAYQEFWHSWNSFHPNTKK